MTGRLRLALVLSGLGHVVHNVEEFGLTRLAAGQTLVPAAVTALLLVAAGRPTRRVLAVAGTWGVIVAVLGGGSVVPWPFLPFVPAQTVSHYVTHVVYAAMQVPLIVATRRGWRASRRPAASAVRAGPSHPDA